jgi:hypothetical protein
MAKAKPLAPCPECSQHEVRLTYDVHNDVYFVACMICGCEGMRCKDERNAKGTWRTRTSLSRQPETCKKENCNGTEATS